MPGAGWIDIMASAGLAAAQAERGAKTSSAEELVHLEEVSFERPLMLAKADGDKHHPEPGKMPTLRVTVEKQPTTDTDAAMPPNGMAVEISTRAPGEEDFVPHATARLVKVAGAGDGERDLVEDLTALKHRCNKVAPVAEFYTQLKEIGLAYGPRFQTVRELLVSDDQALALLKLDPPIKPFEGGFRLHPAILDGALQSAAAVLAADQSGKGNTKAVLVPAGVERVSLARVSPSSELWSHVRLLKRGDRAATIDVVIQDSRGRMAAYLKNVSLRQMDTTPPVGIPRDILWEVTWKQGEAAKRPAAGAVGGLAEPRWLVLGVPAAWKKMLYNRLVEAGMSKESRLIACGETPDAIDMEKILADKSQWDCILHMGSLEKRSDPVVVVSEALSMAQVILKLGTNVDVLPAIWLVTRGTQRALPDDTLPEVPRHAGLWGFSKTARLELENNIGTLIKMGCVDIDPTSPDTVDGFLEQITVLVDTQKGIEGYEPEVALRKTPATDETPSQSACFYSRLQKGKVDIRGAVELFMPQRGAINNLKLRPLAQAARIPPHVGCIEVRVRAVGLNFRDVLNVMGLYPGDPGPPGGDCSGTVVGVGEGVSHLSVGDDVYGVAPGCLRTYVTTDANLLALKPASMTLEEAAALPVVFVTVEVAFGELAKVRKGDNVLVHAASGGVGLAAIQYCRNIGANVFGTAGSQHKQDFVRQQGVQLVTSSRDANQFQADMKQTNSKMDVVLNCLIEDFIPFSLDAMAPKGRFMELGKRGIWSKEEVLARRPDLAMYEAIAIDQMMEQDPKWFGGMLDRLRGLVDVGKVKPIPLHTFDMSSADQVTGGVAAFRFMQRAQHIGKVVIQIPSALRRPMAGTANEAYGTADQTTDIDGCYVITGGFGGLGLLVADWLVEEGAKHIALVSRRGRPTDAVAASELWKKLTAPEPQGRSKAAVHCMAVDVSRKDECEKLFADLKKTLPKNPVRGIFHAAGVLDDAALNNQTKDKVEKVYLPKVRPPICFYSRL